MTVPTTTSSVVYPATGVTNVYNFTWQIAAESDLIVYTTNVAGTAITRLVLTTDYTVTGVGVFTGGTVVLTAGNPTAGTKVFIASDPAEIQQLLLAQGQAFNPSAIMAALDLLTREVQATRRVADNALGFPIAEALNGVSAQLPPAPTRALKFAAYDSTGAPIASSGAIPATIPVSLFGETLVAAADALAARVILGTGQVFFPQQYGAVGNGTSDDTAAVQTTITAAAAAGGQVFLAPGSYRLTAVITLPSNTWIMGPGRLLLDPASYLFKAIRALGSESTALALTINAVAGDKTVTVADASSITVGQMVLMRCTAVSSKYPQEAFVVASKTGTTVTFRTCLTADYATADTAQVIPVSPRSNIILDGVWIDCSAASDIGYLIAMEYAQDVRVQGCRFTGQRTVTSPDDQAGLLVTYSLNTRVQNCQGVAAAGNGDFAAFVYGSQISAEGNQSSGYAFGMGAFFASHVEFIGNSCRGVRAAGNRGIKVSGVYGASISGNNVSCFDSGIKNEDSRDVAIIGNTIEQCNIDASGHGINVSNQIATGSVAASHVITGNVIRGLLGNGILVDDGSYHSVVSGNLIDNVQGRGIIANAQQMVVSGNHIRNWGLAYVGANDQNYSAIYVNQSASVVGNRGHNTLTTVPFIALSSSVTGSTGEMIAANVCTTNDILWVGAATGGQISGLIVSAVGQTIPDPTRRWVGAVGGAAQAVTLTNGQVFTVTAFAEGMLFHIGTGSGKTALFFASFVNATIVKLADPDSLFSVASGTGSKINVFKSANANVITVQNSTGGSVSVLMAFVGTRVASITDPV